MDIEKKDTIEKEIAGQQKKDNRKTDDERIKELDEKLKQLKNQKDALINRQKQKERKERTHRLIQNGALAEQYLNCEKISPVDFELLLKQIVSLPEVKNIIQKDR